MKKLNLAGFFVLIVIFILGWLLINPFIFKQTYQIDGLMFTYPKSWYLAIRPNKLNAEGLIITNTKNVRSLQDAPMHGAKAEVVLLFSPKDDLESYKDSMVSQLSPDSKIVDSATEINGKKALILTIDGRNTENFYSLEKIVLIDSENQVYRVTGGVLRGVAGVERDYYFKIVKQIIDNISIK